MRFLLTFLIPAVLSTAGHAPQCLAADEGKPPPATEAADRLRPFFQPPPEWANAAGSFRSPLRFDDGTSVSTAAQWPRRRQEILDYWHRVMGPWPPLLNKPGFRVLREEADDGFTRRRVELEVAPAQFQEAWLLVPQGKGPFPAVLVVYYEPETSAGLTPGEKGAHRDFGRQLTRDGFVTLCLGTPGGNAWKPDTGKAVCQPLSWYACVAANVWTAMAAQPEIAPRHIGITGHSYGGKWALFGAAFCDRFAAVAVSDPGIVFDETRPNVNYWEPWYLGADPALPVQRKAGLPTPENPRTGAYARLVQDGRDLTDLHALICPRPFLVSGGAEDPPSRWAALNHARNVNRLLGAPDRVAMTNRRNHTPTPESNAALRDFFTAFLKDPKTRQPQ